MEDEQRGKPLRALARSHGLAAAPGGAPKGAPAVTQNSDPPGGKLVGSAPSASSRGSTRPGAAALARGPCAHRCGDGRPSPPRCCVCPPAALAGCRSVFAPLAPRREAGRLVHRTLGEHNAIAQARISPRRSSSSRSYCFPNGTHHRSHMGYIVLVSGENLYWRTRRQLGVRVSLIRDTRKHS